jgi:hypothetical protein
MCQRFSGIFANDISHTGQTSSRSLPITPTYNSRPSTNCSMMAAVSRLSWMNCTRRPSCSAFSTTDACEIPADASKNNDLTMSGKRIRLESTGFRPRRTTVKSGTGMR